MYSVEERLKAVKLYIYYDLSYAALLREFGPIDRKTIKSWYRKYKNQNSLEPQKTGYTYEEKLAAVNYYLEHDKCIARACKELGYPCRPILRQWILEIAPQEYIIQKSRVIKHFTQFQKKKAVISLCTRQKSAETVAKLHGTNRRSLYIWRKQLLGENSLRKPPKEDSMPSTTEELKEENESLKIQRDALKKEIHRLQLERDILEQAAKIIKKDRGITLDTLTNKEKAILIDALKEKYNLKELLSVFHMSKSSYYYQELTLNSIDKYWEARKYIKKSFEESGGCYGYRRVYFDVKEFYKTISEKVIRRIMKEDRLVVKGVTRKKFNSYKGEINVTNINLIERNFKAERPNEKWLTDVTEFTIPAGKIYLSPIIDCFDGLPVSWSISTTPNTEMVCSMLDNAISTLKPGEYPILHSDRGISYQWPSWLERINKAAIKRSMSKKGCSADNSACEGFFGRVKNEMFYNRTWDGYSVREFIKFLDRYLEWYSFKRRKITLGGLSPIQYRQKLGLLSF